MKKKIKTRVTIRKVSVEEIRPLPDRPRMIESGACDGLAASLERFGCVACLVVNEATLHIVSGTTRYELMKAAGCREVYAVMVDLSETEERALALSLNNTAIMGNWTAALIPILSKLEAADSRAAVALRLEELARESDVIEAIIEDAISEKEIDETISVENECPKCGYRW